MDLVYISVSNGLKYVNVIYREYKFSISIEVNCPIMVQYTRMIIASQK